MTGNLCLAVDLTERANGSPLFLNLVLTPLTCICLLSFCLSVHLLNQPSVYPLIPPPIHLPLLTDPSALPFTHLSIHSCIYLSLHSPIYLLIYPFSFLSICPSTPVTGILAWVPLVCKPLPPPSEPSAFGAYVDTLGEAWSMRRGQGEQAAHGLCLIHPTISGWVGRVLAPRPQSRQRMVDMVSLV